MRKLAFLLFLAVLCPHAPAAPVTVDQFEQLLATLHNQRDEKVVQKLAGLELTERASAARLAKWEADFSGKSRDLLVAIADASAFLDLPAADIPAKEMPDAATRKQVLMQSIEFVKTTIHKVPVCTARRNTIHFDDNPVADEARVLHLSPNGAGGNGMTPDTVGFAALSKGTRQLHVIDKSTIVATYRDGAAEVHSAGWKAGPRDLGLTTSGEFGPILTTVVGDAIRGEIRWGHWEQGTAGPIAVLRYAVPAPVSHYALSVGASSKGAAPQAPPYHGEIAIDPATGNLVRITIVSELKPPHQVFDSSIEVEYAPVTIGSATYICPVKGIAISRVSFPNEDPKSIDPPAPTQTFLNDVSFTEFAEGAGSGKK